MRLSVVMLVSLSFALSALQARADETTDAPPPSAPESPTPEIPAPEPPPAFDPTLEVVTDIPAEPPASESEEPLTVHGFWGHIGLGGSAATKDRDFKTGGLDVALGLAYSWRRLRLGGELRYTFLGGFDDPSDSYRYRADIGPLHSLVLFQRDSFVLSVGTRSLFSRAGTRRQKKSGGSWECSGDHCEEVGATFHSIPYRAFYGFTGTADLMLEWRGLFLRASYMRTRWTADHGTRAPKHQDWVQVSFGFSNPTQLTVRVWRGRR